MIQLRLSWVTRIARHLLVPALSLALSAPLAAQAARNEKIAYYTAQRGSATGTLVTWQMDRQRAKLVIADGTYSGPFTEQAGRRRIQLDSPVISENTVIDRCGETALIRTSYDVWLFTPVSGDSHRGKTAINQVGSRTVVTGCDAGQVTPIGSETDRGWKSDHISMRRTPSMADVRPPSRWAGLSESAVGAGGTAAMLADVLSLASSNEGQFDRSGNRYTRRDTADGWMVLELPTGPRGFYRLDVNPRTTQETWFFADMVNDQPVRVWEINVVQAQAAPSFGGPTGAARNWRQRMLGSKLEFRLYDDFTGVRYFPPTPFGEPLTWSLQGELLTMYRPFGLDEMSVRRWEPVSRVGNHQWVLESDDWLAADGTPRHVIPWRLMRYDDEGPGSPPSSAAR